MTEEEEPDIRGVESVHAGCPYCGETLEMLIDCSAGSQSYVEDCEVCCNPMEVRVTIDRDGDPLVELRHQDE